MANSEELLSVVREEYGRTLYTFKAHMKHADIVSLQAKRLQWTEVILTALTAGSVIAIVFGKCAEAIAAIFAFLALLVNVAQLKFHPEREAAEHRSCGHRLWHLREQWLFLISDIMAGSLSDDAARATRDRLTKELAQVYETAPTISPKAYVMAQKALKEGQESTFTPGELDQLLPEKLRQKS